MGKNTCRTHAIVPHRCFENMIIEINISHNVWFSVYSHFNELFRLVVIILLTFVSQLASSAS